MRESKIIVALDYASAEAALAFVDRVNPLQCRVKVGKELFTIAGPDFVRELVKRGFDVFLDLKFHDIPNTVAAACRAAAQLGVWMLNVHALGGPAMMRAARDAVLEFDRQPKLIAVTVLTSMDDEELQSVGINQTAISEVSQLAKLAKDTGLDGVVCSAQEVVHLRRELGQDFLLVTPGIRPEGSEQDDQKRIVTPGQAQAMGVSYIVIGRPITQAADPAAALAAVQSEMDSIV